MSVSFLHLRQFVTLASHTEIGEARLVHRALAERIAERRVRITDERTAERVGIDPPTPVGSRAVKVEPVRFLPGVLLTLAAVGGELFSGGTRPGPFHGRAAREEQQDRKAKRSHSSLTTTNA